ncbi:MAG: hypothetical protein R2710_29300 [Acidimicrobiales bacterium]
MESREFTTAEEQVGASIQRLTAVFDRHDVRGGDKALDATNPDPAAVAAFDEAIGELNRVTAELDLLDAYTYAFVSTDTTDAVAQSTMSPHGAVVDTLRPLHTLRRMAGCAWRRRPDQWEHRGPVPRVAGAQGGLAGPSGRCPRARSSWRRSCRSPDRQPGASCTPM